MMIVNYNLKNCAMFNTPPEMTIGVAWQIYVLTGQHPPTVIQKYHRKIHGCNRPID